MRNVQPKSSQLNLNNNIVGSDIIGSSLYHTHRRSVRSV